MAENTKFNEEFPEGTAMETEAPESGVEAAAAEKQSFTLKDGSQGSRAAYIRELFLVDNLSRAQIAEQCGFPYRVVYSATVNLVNEAEPATRGRSVSTAFLNVTADNKVVIKKEDKIFVNGEEVAEEPETTSVSRNDWVKTQVEAGTSRGDIAKWLDISYGVIYSITKEMEGTQSRSEITLEDGTKISRAAYIRQLFEAGKTRSEIAKELDVPYPVVWQATKTEKTLADKWNEVKEALKEFDGKTDNEELFGQILGAMDSINVIEAAPADAEAPAEAEA